MVEVTGIVTANGTPVPAGIELDFVGAENPDLMCGEARTDDDGRFAFEVSEDCPLNTTFVIQLSELGLSSESVFTVNSTFSDNILVDFPSLTDDQLVALGIDIETPTPEVQETRPLIDKGTLAFIVITLIIASVAVLLWLVYKVTKDVDYRKQTEALVLIVVITAIIILGITAKIGSDGLISVLAAIVGWTAARAAGNK